jgi:hypothetical protein
MSSFNLKFVCELIHSNLFSFQPEAQSCAKLETLGLLHCMNSMIVWIKYKPKSVALVPDKKETYTANTRLMAVIKNRTFILVLNLVRGGSVPVNVLAVLSLVAVFR